MNGFDFGEVKELEMQSDSIGFAIATGRVSSTDFELRSISLKTMDGGENWQQINQFGDFIWLKEIDFLNEHYLQGANFLLSCVKFFVGSPASDYKICLMQNKI